MTDFKQEFRISIRELFVQMLQSQAVFTVNSFHHKKDKKEYIVMTMVVTRFCKRQANIKEVLKAVKIELSILGSRKQKWWWLRDRNKPELYALLLSKDILESLLKRFPNEN